MKTSETIAALAAALVKAQSAGLAVIAHNENQQTRSRYANITDVLIAVLPILSREGIAVLQFPGMARDAGDLRFITLTTRIQHANGEYIEQDGEFPLAAPPKSGAGKDILNQSQNYGLTLTYARRYALLAALGIASGDDRDAQDLQGALQRAAGDGEPTYDEPKAGWWSYADFWQANDAPGHEGKTLGDLTPDELLACCRANYKLHPPVCAALYAATDKILRAANYDYVEYLRGPGAEIPKLRNYPAEPGDMSPSEVGSLYGIVKEAVKPATR